MEKKDIRKLIFARRKAAAEEELHAKSRIICQKVQEQESYQKASCIFAYVDFNREAETGELMEAALRDGKRVAVPRVEGKNMTFYYLESREQLCPGYFQIPEPAWGTAASEEDALLIMPGVAFDSACNRAGYGQGFYDRYLEAHPNHPTIAIAFDFQLVDEVPSEPTDIRPDMVITETACYRKEEIEC